LGLGRGKKKGKEGGKKKNETGWCHTYIKFRKRVYESPGEKKAAKMLSSAAFLVLEKKG